MTAPICVLDIETTGFEPGPSEIIELFILKVQNYEIIDEYYSLFKPNSTMGHNIDNFDLKFLNHFLEQELPNDTIDTLNISRVVLGDKVKNHKLKTLADYFNVISPTHTARDDVMTTFEVYKKLSSIQ